MTPTALNTSLVFFSLAVAIPIAAQETPVAPRPPAADYDPIFVERRLSWEQERLSQQYNGDQRIVSASQLNLFHVRFIDTVIADVPRPVTFTYQGLVVTDRGRNGVRAIGNIGMPIDWGVWLRGLGVFSFWVSTQPTAETAGETAIGTQRLFLNVNHVTGNAGVDTPLAELGGLSVRETLAKLNNRHGLDSDRDGLRGTRLEPRAPLVRKAGLLHRPPVTRRVILERPRELSAQYRADERVVTARQVNLFHLRFIETVMDDLPELVALDYQGLVATDREPGRPRKAGDIGLPLSWALGHDGRAVCTFWLSTQPTPETAAEVPIEGQKLFVNVDSVIGNSGLDIPLPELGDLTVRQTLAKLNNPWPVTLEDLEEQAK